jgi:outer membrane protein TolC
MRFIPTLTAQGTVLASSTGELDNHDVDAQLAVVLAWDIFDGFNRDADLESRTALAHIADLTADTLQRSVEEDIKLAIAQLVSAQAALIASKDAADQSQKSADEENILYQQGLAKAIELIDANDERFEADVAYAQALDTVAEAYVSLRQALGLDPNGTELK